MKHLIDLDDFTKEEIIKIVNTAIDIEKDPKAYYGKCSGKILGTLFYEPSTRTQISFQTAMLKLGGQLVGFDNPATSSVAKGENLKDTIKVISGYADIIAMRHPLEGSAKAASMCSDCHIINAGDGGHLHPTQTLTDLVTLKQEVGKLDGLKIGVCGDLKFGRTVHSLIKMMAKFKGNKFYLISTKELCIPHYLKEYIYENGCSYVEVSSLEDTISDLDILYMTRIQRERFESKEEYEKQRDVFRLDRQKMKLANKNLKIMHPLPRVDEIEIAIDDDERAIYFKQALHGVFARMALILHMFSSEGEDNNTWGGKSEKTCPNSRCITHSESYLPNYYTENEDSLICRYCDTRL